jgi:hypothetical protein
VAAGGQRAPDHRAHLVPIPQTIHFGLNSSTIESTDYPTPKKGNYLCRAISSCLHTQAQKICMSSLSLSLYIL